MTADSNKTSEHKTATILLYASILQEPLAALITLLPFLMIKEIHATTLHISALTALAPTVSILSFYWGSVLNLKSSSEVLRKNLVYATYLTSGLFFIGPCTNDPWFFVLASTSYTLFFRAANPARMEFVKRNITIGHREKLYSWIFKTSYIVGMILGPFLGLFLDSYPSAWKAVFVVSALLYVLSGWLYQSIPAVDGSSSKSVPQRSLRHIFIDPWKASYRIIQTNPLFARFQIGFFIAGFGLMLAKPAGDWLLGNLDISYYALFICRTFLKGLGIIGTSDIWASRLHRESILRCSYLVAWGFIAYNVLLMSASFSLVSVFAAYCIYGIAQSGSHLVWNLSGPLLSGKDSSHQYTAVNILAVGVRGCIAPLLGCISLTWMGVIPTLFFGIIIMFFGARYLVIHTADYKAA